MADNQVLAEIILLFCSLDIPLFCHAWESLEDMQKLREYLFEEKKYNKYIRPVDSQRKNTVIKIDKLLLGISEIKELSQSLTSKAIFRIEWTDGRLCWDKKKYNISKIALDQKEIWLPKLILSNGESGLKRLGSSLQSVEVTQNGHVVWEMGDILVTDCIIDITYFPFDRQTCKLKFTNWELDTVVRGENNSSFRVLQSAEWSVISSTVDIDENDELDYNVILERKPWIYVQNLIIPIILLAILNMATFLIPINSGEKLGYTASVFIAFTVFLTETGNTLPTNSDNVSIVGVYLTVQSVLGAYTIIISTIELRLYQRDETYKIPSCFYFLARLSIFLHCQFGLEQKKEYDDSVHETLMDEGHSPGNAQSLDKQLQQQEQTEQDGQEYVVKLTWPDVCDVIDFYSFWFLFIILAVSTFLLFYLPVTQDSIYLAGSLARVTDIVDFWKTKATEADNFVI